MNQKDDLRGAGKISKALIEKLCSRQIEYDGKIHPGAGKHEILTMLYLCQIADMSGKIPLVRMDEVADVIGCSVRNVYYVFHSLRTKGIVSFSDEDLWTGVRNVVIQGNDYTSTSDYQGDRRYISAFHTCFDFSDRNTRYGLQTTSVFALKTLLIILFEYHPKYGLRISCDEVAKRIGIADRALISHYMEELSFFYGYFYRIRESHRKRHGIIVIRKNIALNPESPREEQLTFYKRKWLLLIKKNDFQLERGMKALDAVNYLFSQIYILLQKSFTLSAIEDAILSSLKDSGGLISPGSLRHSIYSFSPP